MHNQYIVRLTIYNKIRMPDFGPDAYKLVSLPIEKTYGKSGEFKSSKLATKFLYDNYKEQMKVAYESSITVWNGSTGHTVVSYLNGNVTYKNITWENYLKN